MNRKLANSSYSLRGLVVLITSTAVLAGGFSVGKFAGLVVASAALTGMLLLTVPSNASYSERFLAMAMSMGGALVAWCWFEGTFRSQSIGFGWYSGSLPTIAGWGSGICLAAWQGLRLARTPSPPEV